MRIFRLCAKHARNPPKLLEPDDLKKLDPLNNKALSHLADQAYIMGCMHYVLCTESSYKVQDFNFQLSGLSALVSAKKKFKKDEIRFYVLTDQINKIDVAKNPPEDTRAKVDGRPFTVASPGFGKILAPFWFVSKAKEAESANMVLAEKHFPDWSCSLTYFANKKAVEPGEILAYYTET